MQAKFIALPKQLNVSHNFMCTDEDGVVAEVCATEIWKIFGGRFEKNEKYYDFRKMRERVEEWVVEELKSN